MPRRKISQEDRLKQVTGYVTQEKKIALKKLAIKQKTTETDLVRQGVDMILNVNSYKNNINEIAQEIIKQLEPFILAQVNRSIACTMNSIKASSTATYMISYFLNDFVPEERRRNYRQLLFRCNEMAKEYSGRKGSNIGVLDQLKIDDELFLSSNYMTNDDIKEIIHKYLDILKERGEDI